jgi:hypothetical protein
MAEEWIVADAEWRKSKIQNNKKILEISAEQIIESTSFTMPLETTNVSPNIQTSKNIYTFRFALCILGIFVLRHLLYRYSFSNNYSSKQI